MKNFRQLQQTMVRSCTIASLEALVASLTYAATPAFGASRWVEARVELAAARQALAATRATQAEVAAAASARRATAEARKASLKAQYATCARSCAQMIALGKEAVRKTAAKPSTVVATVAVATVVRVTGKTARVAARRAIHAANKAAKMAVVAA